MTAVPLAAARDLRLPQRDTYAFVERLKTIEISPTEFHQCAHNLPLGVALRSDRAEAVAILDPGFQRLPVVAAGGRWNRAYRPIALRCMPFRLGIGTIDVDGQPVVEIVTNVGLTSVNSGRPLYAADGGLDRTFDTALELLRLAASGRPRMADALDRLIAADVLVPLAGLDDDGPVFVVSPERFAALDGPILAALARRDFIALDFAAAAIFSLRHMVPARRPTDDRDARPDHPAKEGMDVLVPGLEVLHLALDHSDLFDLDTRMPPPEPAAD